MSTDELTQKQQELIDSLSSDLEPVKVMRFLPLFGFWFLIALCIGALSLAWLGVRADIIEKLSEPSFFLVTGLSFLVIFAGAYLALKFAIPGESPKPIFVILGVVLPVAILAILYLVAMQTQQFLVPEHIWHNGTQCLVASVSVGFVPWMILFFLLTKMAVFSKAWASFFAALAGLSVGAFTVQMHCGGDSAWHMIVWHYAPIFLGSLIVGYVLSVILEKWKVQKG